ncbi:hypothetical protein ONZ45_g15347 [Pleurotus djamor]|nr:hypothetical protein ONZ45_g15347 [Pleurotus djamor]
MPSKLLSLSFTCLSFAVSLSTASLDFQIAALQSECGTLYEYTVVAGDGCWAIANTAHITQTQLLALNPGLDCPSLQVGDGLCLGLPCATTYEVQSGDWCAKIYDEQEVSAEDLLALNPGFDCAELFPSQRLCVAAPESGPEEEEEPPELPPAPEDISPELPCNTIITAAVDDTCQALAAQNGIQLSQFTEINPNLDCDNLAAGDLACVLLVCPEVYRIQQGDTCASIETDFSLATGDLVAFNPGLSCTDLLDNHLLCVSPHLEEEEEEELGPGVFHSNQYPLFAPGETVAQSQVLSFLNSDNPRDSFFGDVVFQADSQHKATFSRLDANGDGKLGIDELSEIITANPSLSRGMDEVDDTMTHSNFAQRIMEDADTNEDGFIDEAEYMRAIYVSQNLTNEATELALQAENGVEQRRAIHLVVLGIAGLIGLFIGISFADMMRELERKSRLKAGDMLKYLEITHWERGSEPEPKCAAYTYYSTSCAALGHHWSSDCSEGGEKVFDSSCRKPFADGAKACGFLGCSSLCYKISTEGCDCDALKYSAEEGVAYDDPPITTTDEAGVGACRSKCRETNNCVGFSVSPGSSDSRVTCKTFALMALKSTEDRSASFMLSPSCPLPPEGFTAIPFAQLMRHQLIGMVISNVYANSNSISLKKRQNSCPTTPPRKRDFDVGLDFNTTLEHVPVFHNFTRRAPTSVDYRFTYPQTVKGQGPSSWCSAFTFTSVVEVSLFFGMQTNVPLSPMWVAWCRAGTTGAIPSWFHELYAHVGNSYIATEACMPFSSLRPSDYECMTNGCAASQYGNLPYINGNPIKFGPLFSFVGINLGIIEDMKDHLASTGPLYMVFNVGDGFSAYGAALQASSAPADQMVFYDGHPSFPTTCAYGTHAMTVVGYGHYLRSSDPCGTKPRLYWIVLNSWGASFGRNGHVFIELGSMSNGIYDTYGVKVNEGTQWFFNDLPTS